VKLEGGFCWLGCAGESRDWGVRSQFQHGGLRGLLGLSSFLLFGCRVGDFGTPSSDSRSGTVFSVICSLLGVGVSPLLDSSGRLRVCQEVVRFMSLVASYWGMHAHFGGFGFLCLSSRWGVVSFVCMW